MAFCPFPVSASQCCLPRSMRKSPLLSYQVDVRGVCEMKGKAGLSFINSDFLDNHQTISKRYKPCVLKKPGATGGPEMQFSFHYDFPFLLATPPKRLSGHLFMSRDIVCDLRPSSASPGWLSSTLARGSLCPCRHLCLSSSRMLDELPSLPTHGPNDSGFLHGQIRAAREQISHPAFAFPCCLFGHRWISEVGTRRKRFKPFSKARVFSVQSGLEYSLGLENHVQNGSFLFFCPMIDSFGITSYLNKRLPGWDSGKESAHQSRRLGFDPWVGKILWRREWQPSPVFLPGDSPWTEEPGGLQSVGSQRVGHDWATNTHRQHTLK